MLLHDIALCPTSVDPVLNRQPPTLHMHEKLTLVLEPGIGLSTTLRPGNMEDDSLNNSWRRLKANLPPITLHVFLTPGGQDF